MTMAGATDSGVHLPRRRTKTTAGTTALVEAGTEQRSAGGERRREALGPSGQDAERPEQARPEGLVAQELEVVLAGVRRELAGQAEEPATEPLGLSASPVSGEAERAEHVQDLIGHGSEAPEQGIAVQVVDGGLADRELPELLDPLLDEGPTVVGPPGGQDVDAVEVGEDVGALGDLVGIEGEAVLDVPSGLGEGSTDLEREQTHAPERARCGPRLAIGAEVFAPLREPPGPPVMIAQPPVRGDLEEEPDVEALECLDHRAAEEALVDPCRAGP